MAARRQGTYRPKSTSLESLAISRGIIESPASNHPLVERLRRDLIAKGTDGSGFSDLQRRFNVLDRDGSKTLSLEEFKIAFQRCDLNFNDQEVSTLFHFFDNYEKHFIDYEEFLLSIRGPINNFRRELIEKAFQQVDINGEGIITPEELIDRYDPTLHPDVKSGTKKAQDIFRDFLRSFEVGGEVEGKITKNEFINYYYNVSAAIERDDYFEMLMCNCWHFTGFESWTFKHSNNNNFNFSNSNSRRHSGEFVDGNGNEPRTLETIVNERNGRGVVNDSVYGPRSSFDKANNGYRGGNRSGSPGRSSSPSTYYQQGGRTDRPLNF